MADFGILAKIGVDASQMSKGLGKAQSDVDGFGKRIGTAIKAGVLVAGAAIAAMATKGVKDFMEFEKKMAEVFTLMPDMTKQAEREMTADMRNLAKTMGVDLIDATNGLYQAISAGVEADNAIEFLETASQAAIAGVTDLETSVGALTTIMNGYGMEADKAEEISDVLFSTVKIGVTNFTELGQNIGKVTPLAASLGISVQEVGAMFAVLTKTLGAGKTAEAGTQIRSMLAELSKEGMKAFDSFVQATGKTFPAFIKEGGTVTEALRELTDHSKKTGKGLMDMFRGVEAGMGALTLAADNANVLGEALDTIQGDSGSMMTAFERMEQTAGRQFDKMKSNFNDLGITMGAALMPFVNAVLPALTGAFEVLAKAVLKITEFISEHPRLFSALGKILKVLVAGIVGYNAALLVMAIRNAATAVGMKAVALATALTNKSMKALNTTTKLNPFGALLGVITMVAVAFSMFGDASDEAGKKASGAAKAALDKWKELNKESEKAQKDALRRTIELREEMEKGTRGKELSAEGLSALEVELELVRERKNEIGKELKMQGISLKNRQAEVREQKEVFEWARKAFDQGQMTEANKEAYLNRLKKALQASAEAGEKQAELELERHKLLEKIVALEEKTTKEVEDRLNSTKEAQDILKETLKTHQLTQTEMGKALLIGETIRRLDKERDVILDNIRANRRGEVDNEKKLRDLSVEILKNEKALEQILKNKRDKLLGQEIKIHQDAIKELNVKLRVQEKIRDAAKGAAEQAERELEAQRKIAQEGAKELKGLEEQFGGGKFDLRGQRIGVGEFKLSSAKLRQQFRDLQAKGQLPEGVKNLRDFQKQVEDQIRQAQQKARGAGGKANALQAQAQAERAKEKAAADAIADINDKINKAKLATIEAENKLLDREKKTLAEITTERLKLEAALAQVRQKMPGAIPVKEGDVKVAQVLAAAFGQAQQAVKAMETFTTTTGLTYAGSETDMDETVEELETANDTLGDIRHSLEGFFVNQ